MSTRKFAFIASLLSVVGLLAGSAHAAVTIPSTIDTMLDLEGESQSVTGKNDSFFGDGGGIKNGTLDVTFAGSSWWSMVGKIFTVGQGGTLNVKPSAKNASCEMNFKGGGTLIIDGGTVVNENNRGSSYGQYIGCDQTGKGEIRIVNGGTFTSKNLFVRIGYNGGATGILSIDDGTFNVANKGKNLLVACSGATGIVAVTNGTINAQDIELCESSSNVAQLRFVDSELNIMRIWANKNPADGSYCILDGCTINSGYNQMLSDIKIPYQLEGKGLIANPSVDSEMYGYYTARMTFRGNAPIIKTGDKTLKILGVLDGTNGSDGTTGVTDYQVLGGVLDISGGTYLPIEQLNLTAKTGGRFEGGIGSDLTAAYNSLTVDGTVTIPIVFDENGCTPIKAKTLVLDTTDENPVTLDCSGSFVEGVSYCIRENLPEDDVAKLKVTGLDAKLVYRDGNLYAEPNQRANGTVVWQGGSGDNWWDANKWLLDASLTTFVNGDAVVFNTENVAVVLDKNAAVTGLYVTNNVAITGEKTLVAPIIDVTAEKTATIAVPLSEDIEKTGEGELVLQDYADGKALDLKAGQVTLAWSEAAKENPFSTATDVNVIAGVLDLGGAKQAFSTTLSGGETDVFKSGSAIVNGEVTVTPSGWWRFQDTTFTVGKGATFTVAATKSSSGQLGFLGNACLIIDGGTVNALNNRGSSYGGYLGCDNPLTNTIRIVNGGTFNEPNQFLRVGYNGGATGILSVDDGTVNLGNNDLRIACAAGARGVFAMTNGTLTANDVYLCENSSCPATFILSTNSTAKIGQIKKKYTPADGSTVLFDGATLVPTAEGSFLPDLGIEATIGANGLIISNDYDVTVAASLAGAGKLTKKGAGKLTLSGVQTNYTGNIEVTAGTFGFDSGVTFATVVDPTRTLTVAGGTTVDVGYSAEGGFAGTPNLTLSVPAEGTVRIEIDAAQMPEGGKAYKLFGKIEGGTIDNLTITDGYGIEIGEDGSVTVKLSPKTHIWDGEGEDNNWGTAENWDTDKCPVVADSIIFNEGGAETVFDLADGLVLANIEVNAGTWTTKVDQASFANTPLALAQGASFALTDAEGRTNPFSTAKDAVQIAGTLNLGGGSQTLADQLADNNSGSFRNGGTIENGKFTLGSSDVIQLHNVAFTIGTNANVSSTSLFNMGGNGYLKIDGGSFSTTGSSNLSGAGSYIGNYGNATIEILNGSFSHTKERLYIGRAHKKAGNGAIYGINAKIDLGGYELIMGDRNGSTSTLMLTNSTLTCSTIKLGFEGTPGKQTVELVDTKVNLAQFNVAKLGSNSSVLFDGATIVDNHGATQLLADLGIPYTIAEGGLTVKVANLDPTKEEDYVSFLGTFEGEGDFILVAAGKTPREARFTGVDEKGFTGNLVVSNGVTVVAEGKTFKGGLYACEGSTLNVATSVFEGDVTIEEGVRFAEIPEEILTPVTLLRTKGTITSPLLDYKDLATKNRYYVRTRGGINELCYGRKPGTMIIIY